MRRTTKFIIIGIVLALPLIIPILVITYTGFIFPFYNILCNHTETTTVTLFDIFKVWIESKNWSFLGAIGTICGVGIALFKDSFLRWYNSPELSITFKNEKPYTSYNHQTIRQTGETFYAMYLRLQVNNSGRSMAKNVAVRIKEIRKEGNDEPIKVDMYLSQENTGDTQKALFLNIPSGGGMYWDFGIIADPTRIKYPQKYLNNEPKLRILLTYELANGYHILVPGKYDIDILIISDEIKAIERTIEVDTSNLKHWPIIINTVNEDEILKKEEEAISENILFGVKAQNTCTLYNIFRSIYRQIGRYFYAYKICVKNRLVEVEKKRMRNLFNSK